MLATRMRKLITARARKNKRTARMLANARKDHSIPLQIFAEMNNVETRNNREDEEDIVITDDDTEETKDFKHVKVITSLSETFSLFQALDSWE